MENVVLLGNEAIAWGLVEGGCEIVTSYPGTPSSEVLPAVIQFRQKTGRSIAVEWSLNEMIAFQVALGASYTGKRAATIMKQVGLNVAADALMSSAYTGCRGGFVIVSADDPGPYSSQTEQDSRFFAMFAKVPVLDPATPQEAMVYTRRALELSEEFEIPVILRPALRVCHSRQDIRPGSDFTATTPADFRKDPHRWAATPKYRYQLHLELNRKLEQIAIRTGDDPGFTWEDEGEGPLGIIAGGVLRGLVQDFTRAHDLRFPLLHLGAPFPLPQKQVREFIRRYEKILVLEETAPVIETQISESGKLMGRRSGHVPSAGEIDGRILENILSEFVGTPRRPSVSVPADVLKEPRRPSLCPGCPHRSSFYAIRKALPKGIYTSDIGCYTLGVNLKAVDTVLVMGAAIGLAMGISRSYDLDRKSPPVIATIGDSTFLHSGLPQLANAVYNRHRIIVMILDNSVTAMTGMQPAVSSGLLADGSPGTPIHLEDTVRGCGATFLEIVDPYDQEETMASVARAYEYTQSPAGGVAVIIARHPCLIHDRPGGVPRRIPVAVDEERCTGCLACVRNFECPAIIPAGETVHIDTRICVQCGQCIPVCPFGALVAVGSETEELP
ncbi:MAG: 4Fe-4S binding protein [Acidobacteria bacterium]|nr:4Fe-4S binding protein [Acidobacteriota bacterium]